MPILWSQSFHGLILLIDHWQTLITGAFAIVAALIGGQYITHQISETRREETDKRERKFKALRAVLPLTLSYVVVYARDSAWALKQVYNQRVDQEIPTTVSLPSFPTLPKDVVGQFQEIVEFGNDNIGNAVSDMLAKIQVQSARVESLIRWRNHPEATLVTTTNIARYIVDAAEIYRAATGMFEFARRKSETLDTNPTKDQLASALNQIGFWSEDFPTIHELARKG